MTRSAVRICPAAPTKTAWIEMIWAVFAVLCNFSAAFPLCPFWDTQKKPIQKPIPPLKRSRKPRLIPRLPAFLQCSLKHNHARPHSRFCRSPRSRFWTSRPAPFWPGKQGLQCSRVGILQRLFFVHRLVPSNHFLSSHIFYHISIWLTIYKISNSIWLILCNIPSCSMVKHIVQ